MRKSKETGNYVGDDNMILPRSQVRKRFSKYQATIFLVGLSFMMVMMIATLLSVKLTIAFNGGPAGKQDRQLLSVIMQQKSLIAEAMAQGKTGNQKPKATLISALRSRDELGIGVSRGAAPRQPKLVLPSPPPATSTPSTPAPPVESPNTIAWINSLNRFLAGSPMAGMGEVFYKAAGSRGVDPRLSPSIAKIESNLGRAIPGGYNAFGMTAGTAPGHGRNGHWQAFTGWQDAIESNISFIKNHWGSVSSPYSMKGYCVGGSWAGNVSSVMSSIGNPGP